MPAEQTLQRLRSEVLSCHNCGLAATRENAVPGEGPTSARVMLIGEGPGFHENRQGKPFVGQAGLFLEQLLKAAGLNRTDVFITNVVKCRPPENRDPLPEELLACRAFLDAQIEALNPAFIVTLGRYSMGRFIENGRISQIHGCYHRINGRMVVTMYHPAAALHQPALRQLMIDDFTALGQKLMQNAELHANKEKESPKPPTQGTLFDLND